jgi:type VI secretion system protein ImpL
MKRLSFLVSPQCLALVALVLVALVIWFVGPLFAFGGLKPLAGAGMRVLVIALLLAGLMLWLIGWSTSVVFVALLCLLIWYAAPLLALGHAQPFAPASARLMAIAVVLTVFVIYWLNRLWQRMRSDEPFLKSLLEFGGRKTPSPAASQLQTVDAVVVGALARLKAMRREARGPGNLFQGKRHLYALPWYLALGSTASGKTSAVLNAGLPFPLAERMLTTTLARAGGARHVDCWIADDAVLIDTAAHYTRPGTSLYALPRKAKGKSTATASLANENRVDEKQDISEQAGSDTNDTSDWRKLVDQAEWLGFLGILRRHRPRTPINGALLMVDLAELTSLDESGRLVLAAALHARLAELRIELGIRFPVYVLVTKMDRLPGFTEYFGSLTAEGRAQPWGFTLPYGDETITQGSVRVRGDQELDALAVRLAAGVNTRLLDEYDLNKRRRLATLPREFTALIAPLGDLIERVFLDTRHDATQRHATLRGIYFTSAMQDGSVIPAERHTLVQRARAASGRASDAYTTRQVSQHGYFLHDLLTKVVFAEGHLVRPNLRWEFRFRLLRLIGHALALLLFAWLALGLRVSFSHNTDYLAAIGHKTQALTAKVTQLYRTPQTEAIPDTLTDARDLPAYRGLDLSNPANAWQFGLYTAAEIQGESHRTYDALEDTLLLPPIVHRMEAVISQAIANKDAKTAYDALRVYLMLYDKQKFKAQDVKAWVLDDWAKTDSAAVFGGRASMINHVQQLFSGDRVVQSPLIRNDALIQQARAFLDGSNATDRLYERAKTAMQADAPDEFSVIRAVGPQAGTVFTRASGAPLSRGVPGLFTFDGYRNLFDKRLTEFVRAARDDDAWVMGRSYLTGLNSAAQKKTAEMASDASVGDDPLTAAIRREYLLEYAQQWDSFLGDIRTVTGTSLPFSLAVLRSFAAPDSPLARLARAAVRETTLTQAAATSDGAFLKKATDRLSQNADPALGIRASERVERELVDNHFAALREVVTGQADAQSGTPAPAGPSSKTGLDGVTSLLNEYYTALTVADNALSNNSMPPSSDTAAKIKMTADTMPAPFREVLLALGTDGSREVNQGIGQLLSRQMQAVVGDTCRLTIEGNYPFAPDSRRDVSIDDFTRVFARGGVIDDFFTKTLEPFVDTAAHPWRYRTLPGATEPVQGPDLEPFEHAQAIRDAFFGAAGQQQLSWKADIRIPELDPTITGLMIDIDGQTTLYQHGPVRPFTVIWPGARGGVHAEITASPRIRSNSSTISTDGPWAWMHLLQKGQIVETATPGRTRVAFDFDGRRAVLDIASTGSVANPLTSDVLKSFKCPSSMPMLDLADHGPPPGLPSLATSAVPLPGGS